jgi:hypothetical protein
MLSVSGDDSFGFNYFMEQGMGTWTAFLHCIKREMVALLHIVQARLFKHLFEGLHMKIKKLNLPIYVTDIQPGFVDTKMAKSNNASG